MSKSMPPEVAAAVRNIRKARVILHDWGWDPEKALRYLVAGNLITTPPRIIRTLADLESIDPDTILGDSAGPYTAGEAVGAIYEDDYEDRDYLPAAVIATGEQVRAARQALEAPMPLTDNQAEALTNERRVLPVHRTEAGYPNCSTCDGGGCLDCTDPAQ